MGLTRPRAAQIYDIDYKQSVRVITTTNITLSGGAPTVVDGVTLSLNDRILVTGQSTASQNGIYIVSVLGTGANGTWVRSSDTNATGELESGTIVMVTEGSTYADTSWKLTTNDPIVIGTTALTFEINTGNAFGTISANGTSVVSNSATGTVTFSTGNNIVITGNAASDTITFAVRDNPTFWGNVNPGANVTYDLGNTTSRWRDIWLANSTIYLGNAQISANATSVIITNPAGGTTVLSGASPAVDANTVTATGNITGGNLITGGILSVTGNANVGNLGTTGIITVTGNVTANNFVGNLTGIANTANWLYIVESPDDNVTYNLPYIGTTGAANGYRQLYSDDTALTFNPSTNLLTVASATHGTAMSSPNVATTTTTGTTSLFTTITSGTLNIMTGQTSGPLTIGGASATGAINIGRSTASQSIVIGNGVTASGSTKTIDIGTLGAANSITNINIGPVAGNSTVSFLANARVTIANALSVTGNANVGNLGATNANLTAITATGNANVGNLGTAGQITATGNVTGGNLNVSGNIVDTGALFLITGASGNVTLSPNGTDVVIATTTGANITGTLNATGNANVGNLGATNANLSAITVTGNANVGNLGTTAIVATGAISGSTTLSVTGNANVGNLGTSGLITATGAITGASINVPNAAQALTATPSVGFVLEPSFQPNYIGTQPFGSSMWVDKLRFIQPNTVETSTDGTTWTSTTDVTYTQKPFNGIVTQSTIPMNGTTLKGLRWTWSSNIQYSAAYWLGIAFQFATPAPTVTVQFETSTDGVSWTSRYTTSAITVSNEWVYIYTPENGYSVQYYRITLLQQTNTVNFNALQWYTARPGDQGSGQNNYFPFTYDFSKNVTFSNTATVTGNISAGNISTTGLLTATGNITGGNLRTSAVTIASTGAISGVTTISASGNANVGNLGATNANLTALTTSGNVTAGGISTAGNISAAFFLGNVACASGIFTTKIFSGTSEANIGVANGNANITIGGVSNVAVFSTAGANITGTLGVTGNITGGNVSGTLLTGTLTTAAQPNVTSVGTLTSLTASGNVTGGNLITTGTVSTGTLTASGNVTVAGNLTVTGNVISVNVTDLNVVDPIIGLGRGANNTPLTSNDGKDRGEQLWYYTTSEQSAFIGYDNSAGKLIAATNVSIASEVVTVNSYGNIIVGGLEATTISSSGNANVGNIGGTRAVFTNLVGTLETADQPNITSVGTLSSLTVTANVTGGNLITSGQVTATGNITGGNLITSGALSVASLTVTGNVTSGNLITSGVLSATGNANVGNLGATNANLTAITATGNANVGNLGTAGQITATGNVTGGNLNVSGNIVDTGALFLITGASGNVTLAPNGSSVVIATTTGANITGTLNATGNANVGNLGATNANVTDITATGNANVGNLGTAGLIVATGNITGGNLITAGLGSIGTTLTVTGNANVGNLGTAGQIIATGNIHGALIKSSANVEIQNRGILFLNDSDNSNYVGLRSPAALTGNYIYIFPSSYGNADQVLSTNGSGGLSWVDQSGGGGSGATSYPNSTVQPVPGSTGNFDLSYNFVQTVQEVPFESSATDPFGVNLGEVYSMMDPVGEVLEGVDLGVLT